MRNKPINYSVSRTSPVAEYGSKPGQGRLHIVSGGLGAELMNTPQASQWYVGVTESVLHYVHFEIDNNVLFMKAIRADGTLMDSVVIEKEDTKIQRSITRAANFEIHSYPNPANSSVKITLPNSFKNADVFIHNIQGKLIAKFTGIRTNAVTWNPKKLPNGIYIIYGVIDKKRLSKRLYLLK
jgi:hypothetical protein